MKKLLTKIIAVTKNQCTLFVTHYQNRKNKQLSLVSQRETIKRFALKIKDFKSIGFPKGNNQGHLKSCLLKSCKDFKSTDKAALAVCAAWLRIGN